MKTNIMILAVGLVIGGGILYMSDQKQAPAIAIAGDTGILPAQGVPLSMIPEDIVVQLQTVGAIDRAKFNPVFPKGPIVMTQENEHELLNALWAFGLANKNPILEQGPMMDPRYGGADRFASTGGWSLSVGSPMDHYSMHAMVVLTPQQQAFVESVSKNIYRPCCDNSTYFPDCNHGMAMLGLLELMAAQGASEQEMYKTALAVNSYWFPSQYEIIAQLNLDPKTALSAQYSSGSGFRSVLETVKPVESSGGSSCGV